MGATTDSGTRQFPLASGAGERIRCRQPLIGVVRTEDRRFNNFPVLGLPGGWKWSVSVPARFTALEFNRISWPWGVPDSNSFRASDRPIVRRKLQPRQRVDYCSRAVRARAIQAEASRTAETRSSACNPIAVRQDRNANDARPQSWAPRSGAGLPQRARGPGRRAARQRSAWRSSFNVALEEASRNRLPIRRAAQRSPTSREPSTTARCSRNHRLGPVQLVERDQRLVSKRPRAISWNASASSDRDRSPRGRR